MFEDVVIPTPEAVGDIAICIIVSGELERQAEVTINQVGGSAQCEYYLYIPCTTQTEHGWQDMHCMVIITWVIVVPVFTRCWANCNIFALSSR